jgi:glycosyltransferase involved in cell wall biosynthesis
MKILLLNNLFAPYSRGGAERIVELMATELRGAGHEIIIVSTKPLGQESPKIISTDKLYYLPSLYLDLKRLPFFLRPFWHLYNALDFGQAHRLEKIIIKEKPDLAIAHNLLGLSGLTPWTCKRRDLPYVQILHDIQLLHPSGLLFYGQEKKLDTLIARSYQALNRRLFDAPDLVVSPSAWLLDLHREYGFFKNSKTLVLPNPVSELITGYSHPKNNKTILYVGQIDAYKGVLLLLEAWKNISDQEAKLILAGDGQLYEKLRNANTDARVNFLGRQDRDQINMLLSEAGALIVPSLVYENSPTVIYEAAAAGVPIMASDIGGIPELVKTFGGRLFTPGDASAIAETLNHYLNLTPEEREKLKPKLPNTEPYSEKILREINK